MADEQLYSDGNIPSGNSSVNIRESSGPDSALSIGQDNVGVGTTSPAEKLEVNGNIALTDYENDRVWATRKVFNVLDYGAVEGIKASGTSASINSSTNVLTISGTLPPDVASGDILWVNNNDGNYGAYEIQSKTTTTITVTNFSVSESSTVEWRVYSNNQDAFQDALDAADNSDKGGIVYVPEGVYMIYSKECPDSTRDSDNTGLIIYDNTALVGACEGPTVLLESNWDSTANPPKGTLLLRAYEADNNSSTVGNAKTCVPFIEISGSNITIKGLKIFYPIQRYLINNGSSITPSAASWSSNIITFTASGHSLSLGDTIEITGSNPADYNGSYLIQNVDTSPDTFSVYKDSDPGAYTTCNVQKKEALVLPYAIKNSSDTYNTSIIDILLLYPYLGVDLSQTHTRHFISGLYGSALKEGITIDNCSDTGKLINIHFNPQSTFCSADDLINCWTMSNCIGIKLLRSDLEIVDKLLVYGHVNGIYFGNEGNGKTWANLSNIILDNCDVSINADQIASFGARISNIIFSTGGHNYKGIEEANGHMIGIYSGSDNTGFIELCNATFAGVFRRAIEIENGSLSGSGITFKKDGDLISGSLQKAVDVTGTSSSISVNLTNVNFPDPFGGEVISMTSSNPSLNIDSVEIQSGDSVSSNACLKSYKDNKAGINTTSPDVPLHIEGGGGLSDLAQGKGFLQIGEFSSQNLRFDNNEIQSSNNGSASDLLLQKLGGNTGINTSTPAELLHIYDGNVKIDNPTGDAKLLFTNGDSDDASIQYDSGDDGMEFRVNGTGVGDTKLFLGNDGKVGVGTITPSDKLEVYGNGENTALRVHEDNENYEAKLHLRSGSADWEIANYQGQLRWRYEGSELIRVSPDGDVGIGTTSPNEKLDVQGDIEFGTENVKLSTGLGAPSGGSDGDLYVRVDGANTGLHINVNGTWKKCDVS